MQNLKEHLFNKKIILLAIVLLIIGQYALGQSEISKKKIKRSFIRIYRFDGKVNRGTLVQISDSILILQTSHEGVKTLDSIHYNEISFVRKGRSVLHHFVVKGIIGFGIALPFAAVGQATTTAGATVANSIVSPITGSGQPLIPESESHVFSNSLKAGLLVGLCSALIHLPDQQKLRIDGSSEKFEVISKTLNYLSK